MWVNETVDTRKPVHLLVLSIDLRKAGLFKLTREFPL
jgi:hypothetical protein